MKIIPLAIFLALTFLPCWANAQEVTPPEGARILAAGSEGVVLRWPGNPKAKYFVQIYANQVPAVEQQVSGNSIAVPLRSGIGYQWKVNLITESGYQEVVASRSFQTLPETPIVLLGKAGANGNLGTYRSGFIGTNGQAGQPGPSLTATLQPVGDYVDLQITGAPANRQMLFAPGAAPLILASRGGTGGAGGPGYRGIDSQFNYNNGWVTPPEPGGDGGNGGDGGPGGTIVVISNGLDISKYLLFDTRGGDPGAPGPGGRGGEGVIIPPEWQRRRLPQGYGYGAYRAPSGVQGSPGREGAPGQVVVR